MHLCEVVRAVILIAFLLWAGVISEDLHLFLETNLPQAGKAEGCTLGVIEPKLGAAITESLGVACQHVGAVPEVIRGIRAHFPSLVKGMCFHM